MSIHNYLDVVKHLIIVNDLWSVWANMTLKECGYFPRPCHEEFYAEMCFAEMCCLFGIIDDGDLIF